MEFIGERLLSRLTYPNIISLPTQCKQVTNERLLYRMSQGEKGRDSLEGVNSHSGRKMEPGMDMSLSEPSFLQQGSIPL